MYEEKYPFNVDVKQPVELRFARFGQRGEFAVPCVIDQVVESGPPPDAGQRAAEAVGEGREAGGLRHIQRQGDGLAAQGADVGDHRFRLFETAAVGDDDIPTLAGDIQCGLTAKAAVGAGNKCNFSHVRSSLVCGVLTIGEAHRAGLPNPCYFLPISLRSLPFAGK